MAVPTSHIDCHNLKVCHDFDSRSLRKFKVTRKKNFIKNVKFANELINC